MAEFEPTGKSKIVKDKLYELIGPLKRVVSPLMSDNPNVHKHAIQGGNMIELEKGTIVKCLGLDSKGTALFIVEGSESQPEHIGKVFPSSPRTQGLFQLIEE